MYEIAQIIAEMNVAPNATYQPIRCKLLFDSDVEGTINVQYLGYYELMIGSTAHDVRTGKDYEHCGGGVWREVETSPFKDVYTKSEINDMFHTTNKRIDENYGALKELVDTGAKNLVQFMQNGGTFYGTTFAVDRDTGILTTSGTATGYKNFRLLGDPDNVGWQYGVPIPKGSYKLTGLPAGASSSTFRFIFGITESSTDIRQSIYVYDNTFTFDVTNDTTRIDLSAYVSQGNIFSSPTDWTPMIANQVFMYISDKFVPYAPTLQELYRIVRSYHGS